ncbi:MAG: carbohydrate ABC transporter permease [Clostridia bacterium]|nr:carbohydrate ABC transporter permease [Clostridia bacterium]
MARNQITLEQYIGFRKKKEFNEKRKVNIGKIASFVFLLLFCIMWISPFIIMFFGSFRGFTDTILYPKELFYPHSGYTLENYEMLLMGKLPEGIGQVNAVQDYKIGTWLLNSCFSAIGGTLLYLLVASLAAYAFTFIDFRYRDLLFAAIIASMVIPGAATSVGNQSMVYSMGLNRSLLALIIPGLGGVYGMYLIKTFFESIPKDLIESAKMDGYSNFKIFYKIVLPLGKNVLFVQGLFGFMGGWNDLIWPQMLYGAKDTDLWTLQVGMAYIINNSKTSNLIGTALAGGVICLLPVLVMYIIAQDKIIEGMSSSGIKG